MNKIEKKLQKLQQTLKVSGGKYNKDKIGIDRKDIVLQPYMSFDEDLYNLAKGPEGFYIMDGSKFDEILKNYTNRDSTLKKDFINELKNTYPIIYQTKNTQKKLIPSIMKRFIWDVGLYNECIKELCEGSIFCDTRLMNKIVDYLPSEYPSEFHQVVYINYDNDQNAKDIFICDDNFNYINKIEEIIEKIPNPTTIGKIKVTNNKINFFVPFDFDKTEAPQRNRYSTPKAEKFEERAVKCPNGEYEIQLFIDDIFYKNQSIIKKYKEEIFKYDLDNIKIGATNKTVENQYKKFIEMSGVLKNKYPIKDMGTHVYYIKLND